MDYFTGLTMTTWNTILDKDSYLNATRNYQNHLRILKNSLVIDEYGIRGAALPVEAEFITCITLVQKLFYESHVIGERIQPQQNSILYQLKKKNNNQMPQGDHCNVTDKYW